MTLKNKIQKTLVGLGIAGMLTLPQIIDHMLNGPYKVTQIGEGISRKIIHEYDDKISVTGCWHPWGTRLVDEGKDGILDGVYYAGLPRVAIHLEIEPGSKFFQDRQAEYEELMKRYKNS